MDRSHALIVLAVGCGTEGSLPAEAGPIRATEIVSAPGATGEGFLDAERAVNGVRGGGRWQGGLDVFSLAPDDVLVLGFAEPVFDVEGPDLAVFENPFDVESGGRFFDPVVVEVSVDCDTFVAFPVGYLGDPEVWSGDPAEWTGFAGLGPVELHEEDHPVDPLSADAGGDRFDLADLGEAVADGVTCVRLTAASAWEEPGSGLPYPSDPISNGPDIDGVYAAAP